jgi:hypothetical protein
MKKLFFSSGLGLGIVLPTKDMNYLNFRNNKLKKVRWSAYTVVLPNKNKLVGFFYFANVIQTMESKLRENPQNKSTDTLPIELIIFELKCLFQVLVELKSICGFSLLKFPSDDFSFFWRVSLSLNYNLPSSNLNLSYYSPPNKQAKNTWDHKDTDYNITPAPQLYLYVLLKDGMTPTVFFSVG